MGKRGGFPDPGIRILPFDPIWGDEAGKFPVGVPLRREGSHIRKVFSWHEQFQVAEKGEFHHTDLVNLTQT